MPTPETRNGKFKTLAVNLGVSAVTIALVLLVFELVVFRFVLPGSDVPRNAFVDEVVRYAPNQSGIWRVRNDVHAPYAINGQGWNSGRGDYKVDRKPGVLRVAVVGDSYIEALQVPHDRSVGEHIGRHLGERLNQPVEVDRFGIGGAPLSQYLHMVEREVARYRPDWIVILLVHNDFDESFAFVPGRYTSSFLKLKMENAKVVGEVRPTPWRPSSGEWLRHTATARFFYYRWQVRADTLRNVFIPTARAATPQSGASIEAAEPLPKRAEIEAATEYLFRRLSETSKLIGARLLLVADGDRAAIYRGQTKSTQLALNHVAAKASKLQGIAFLDLHPVFLADWTSHGARFDFPSDYHWNERGHALAAAAIARAMEHGR